MGERRRRDDRCGGQTGGYEEGCAVAARAPALYARVPDSEVRFPASLSRTPLRSGCQRPGSRAGAATAKRPERLARVKAAPRRFTVMARERRSVGYICLNMLFCLCQANAMKEAILIREAARTLSNRLPPGWREKILASKPTAQDRPDGTLEITSPDGTTARMVFEAKSRVFPRDVAELKNHLERFSSGPYIVVAQFLVPDT